MLALPLFFAAAIGLWALAVGHATRWRVGHRVDDVRRVLSHASPVTGLVPGHNVGWSQRYRIVMHVVIFGACGIALEFMTPAIRQTLGAWIYAVTLVVLVLVSVAGVLHGGSSRAARLVAFTADGWVWLIGRRAGYVPTTVLGRKPLTEWRPRRWLGRSLQDEIAGERVVVPRIGFEDQLP